MRVFGGVVIWRAIAAERHTARLTGTQMDPVIADFHAFSALANFRLFDGCDRIKMRTAAVRH